MLFVLSALYFAFDRDFYLPFLGECVIPYPDAPKPLLNQKPYKITGLPSNVNLMYWAAETSENGFANYKEAYSTYANSGNTKTDSSGNATIVLTCPGQYNVGKTRLKRHFHYRYELPDSKGMFSKVFTQDVEC
jgi:hypothetical protein